MNILDNLEELGFDTKIQFDEFKEYFREKYAYVYNISVTDQNLIEFLKQPYIRRVSIEQKADYFYDYIMSQGLCEYTE